MNSELSTPLAGKKMSQSLRERLRKSGRTYKSPVMKKSTLDADKHFSPEINKASLPFSKCDKAKSGSTNSIALKCDNKNQQENREMSLFCDKSKSLVDEKDTHHSPPEIYPNDFTEKDVKKIIHSNTKDSLKRRTYLPLHSSVSSNVDRDLAQESGNDSHHNAKQERKDLLQRISTKEERLRKLRMVKMYRTKNNLDEVENLISKWRTISQEALMELLNEGDPKPTLKQLLEHLQIDHDLIHYNEEEDSFV